VRTNSEENKDWIRRFWDAMNTRRLDPLDELLAADVAAGQGSRQRALQESPLRERIAPLELL
jgi:hypothetical protein